MRVLVRQLPEIRAPQTNLRSLPHQGQGAHWSLSSPQKHESIRVTEGQCLAPPTLRLVSLCKLLLSRFCPRVHPDECNFSTKLEP